MLKKSSLYKAESDSPKKKEKKRKEKIKQQQQVLFWYIMYWKLEIITIKSHFHTVENKKQLSKYI